MENTGIGKEKEEFVQRKNPEEFFKDGKAIEELYVKTFQLLLCYSTLRQSGTLDVFNNAYMICQSCLQQKPYKIHFRNSERKCYSYAVALVLLQLHQKFYSIDDEYFRSLRTNIGDGIWKRYQTFAQENELTHPIFCGKKREPDFALVKECVMLALDEATRLKEENNELSKLLEEERARRIEADGSINELTEKLEAWENNSFYKAVNIQTIVDYVQDEDNNLDKKDVDSIKMILLGLCANKVPDKIIKKIRTLKPGGKLNFSVQNNNGCQQFYGPVKDSEFPTKQ